MGTEFLGIGVEIRKGLIFTVRCCFRSVYNHPFFVGFLCFLIVLSRSSPFVFSMLVSAYPVLVCTTVLLGVILSYGEPNVPEIEIEEKKTKFEANGSYFVRRSGEKRGEGLDDTALPLIEEGSREIGSDCGEIWEEGEDRGLSDLKLKTEWIDEKLNDEVLESDGEKSEAESFDSEKVNVASLDSPPRSPWTQIEEDEDEWAEEEEDKHAEGEKDEEEDSRSDQTESSSSDASMADIMPMLDELHPLLDEETSLLQPVRGSHSGSDVTDSRESDEVSEENHNDLEDDQVDDDDNEEGEDDAQGDKAELTKSAITWTEEDQKNLMDLGSSEIERNQRLEKLILRRRSRKNTRMIHEMNLIDLESTNYPSGLAPISTRRRNPFDDLHHDSYDEIWGLPLIPGSAPSVMLQRRNPFDIPYDSTEEKPDLMGDGFKEEFATSQLRGAVFRRHKSFNVRPSVFAPDVNGARMRPYFVPEYMISEESSYCSSFTRQSSELSESKVSYVPETESTGLVEDLDDWKLLDEYHQHEIEASPQPRKIYEDPLGDPQLISHQEEDEEEDINVGHGRQSSEDEESVEVRWAKLEIQLEDVADHYQQERVNGSVEAKATDYHPNNEGDEHVYRRDSSSSSLSEVSDRVFTEIDAVDILSQTSTEIINPSVSGALAIDIPQRAPIYDLSPRPDGNNIMHETSTTHPMDVDIKEHDNVNIDFSEVENEIDLKISDLSISLNSFVEALVVEEHGSGEISGARDAENIHNLDKSLDVQFEVSEPLFEGRVIQLEEVRETVRSPDSHDDAYQRADEKLISTASVDGNAYPFHDVGEIREPNFQHLDEVQALSALVDLGSSEDTQITQNLNISEVQELDRDIPSKINSPLSPESIFNPPSATETTESRFNMQPAVEQVNDIKEIDEDILAELDSVGDFSVQQWGTGSTGFEKCFDSVEDVVHSEKWREDIDIHEESVECVSEPQICETSEPERIEVSRTEFDERDSPDSSDSKTSGKIETQSYEKTNSFSDAVKSETLVENEITYTKTAYGMPELEAGKIEDIDVAFKEITAEKPDNEAQVPKDSDSISYVKWKDSKGSSSSSSSSDSDKE